MKVTRPTLTFVERFYVLQILRGLWQTLKHIPRKPQTVEYPEVKPTLHGAEYRGVPTLVRDPDGHSVQFYSYMEQIGWQGAPRPAAQRRKVEPGVWPETLPAASDSYTGEPFLGPWE